MANLRDRLQEALAGRYQLQRELGRGGMATVYLAHDLRHGREVALKLLHPELATTLGPERFQREIRTTARLRHPHILPVLDSGEAAGQLWYTMPFVDGESLRDRLRRERQLPLEDALQITRQVADALGYAHRQGVVHRDIKPENILLSEGHALVADFGVARALRAAGGDHLTETGMSVGTPAYMSPEQSLADPVLDGRSDLYSLGCVLYEMLAGEAPYTGTSAQAIVSKRLREPVPHVCSVRETVPLSVDRALEQVLAKTPADRYPTAEAFAQALGVSVPPPGPTPTRTEVPREAARRVHPGLLAGGAVLSLAVMAGFLWSRGLAPPANVPRKNTDIARIAVLPFDNLGDSADGYFADGITDAVRDKLAALPGLEVIASTSSGQYHGTTKQPSQIGRELNARYLLVGKVRWARQQGVNRVQVRPELVDAATGAERWGEPFDADLSDIFGVQADIARRVAEALGVALGARERSTLVQRPTQNLEAYDAYLRALTTYIYDTPEAIGILEQAVALDSTFALAWAQLALMRQNFSSGGITPLEQIERSKGDAEHALILQPDVPLAYYALGQYYSLGRDYDRALAQYARGLEVAPNNVRLLSGVVEVDMRRGQLERAALSARKLETLDPRSTAVLWDEAVALQYLRRSGEARAVVDRALQLDSLNPAWYLTKVQLLAGEGDLSGARQVLGLAERRLGYSRAVAFLGRYWSSQWVLPDSSRAFLLRLRPGAMESDSIDWGLSLAVAASSLSQHGRARAYADTARRVIAARLSKNQGRACNPRRCDLRPVLCLASALAGYVTDARQQCLGLLGQQRWDALADFEVWTYARAMVAIGNVNGVAGAVEQLLHHPSRFTRAWFRLDPTFVPLRGNPRFERLVNGS